MSGAVRDNLHATLVAVADRGVLITGPARSGKSSLALCLLRAAARENLPAALVADDRVELSARGAGLSGRAPAMLQGLIEVSGAGLLRLPVREEAGIDLVAELQERPERMPEERVATLLGIGVRRVGLPHRQGPFAADILITLLLAGDDAVQNF